jgi:hypothetical protein
MINPHECRTGSSMARGEKLGGPKLAQARKVALETIGAASPASVVAHSISEIYDHSLGDICPPKTLLLHFLSDAGSISF